MPLQELPFDDLPWHRQAACTEPEVNPAWFHSSDVREVKHAVRVCKGCPVSNECLQYALSSDDNWGVWGGLTDRQRRSLSRQRRLRPMATA